MMAGIFVAFTFEAYLNHIGQDRVKDWDTTEWKYGPHEKLKYLQESLGFIADKKLPPFNRLNEIFHLRDLIAHGKTKTASIDKVVKNHKVGETEYPQVDWKKLCTLPKVIRMVENVELMIRSIHEQLGYKRDPFASPEHGSSYVSVIDAYDKRMD